MHSPPVQLTPLHGEGNPVAPLASEIGHAFENARSEQLTERIDLSSIP
jgi:hypothetical protein